MVRRSLGDNCASIRQYSYAKVAECFAEVVGEPLKEKSAALSKIHQALQPAMNEMFFTQRLVLVEGLEDIAYIHSWLILTERWEAFRGSGCHVVAVSGKSEMIRPAIIAKGFEIPVFAIVDADGDKIHKPEIRSRHHRDNLALIRLFKGDESVLFPITTYWTDDFVMWPSDLADTVNREFIEALGVQGAERFEHMRNGASLECGNAGGLEKNAVYIGNLLEQLKVAGVTSRSLDQLCDKIIAFGG
jgi:hypothetical protein